MLQFKEIPVDRLIGLSFLIVVIAAILGVLTGYVRMDSGAISIGSQATSTTQPTSTPRQAEELTPMRGWTNYGGSFETAGFLDTGHGVVMLKGLVKGCAANEARRTIAQLPDSAKPSAVRVLSGHADSPVGQVRIDVTENGWIVFRGPLCSKLPSNEKSIWVSLEGISFTK